MHNDAPTIMHIVSVENDVDRPRYSTVLEPFGGFTVFDSFEDRPAEMGGHVFIGLSEDDAAHACMTLNALHGRETRPEEGAASERTLCAG